MPESAASERVAELVERAARIPTAVLADAAGGEGVIDPAIGALQPGAELCGPALTAACAPGDVLGALMTSLEGEPGEVLVVGGLDAPLAIIGGFMARACVERGIAGAVLDGYARDVDEVAERLPVFCRGTTPRNHTDGDRGRSRVPVGCGGVEVAPGDIVRGDADGVIFVSPARAPEVLRRGEELLAKEQAAAAAIEAGAGLDVYYGPYLDKFGGKA